MLVQHRIDRGCARSIKAVQAVARSIQTVSFVVKYEDGSLRPLQISTLARTRVPERSL